MATKSAKSVPELEEELAQAKHRIKVLESFVGARNEEIKRLKDFAYRDELTGLWKRTPVVDRLDQEIAARRRKKDSGSSIVVLALDLVGFSRVNNIYGHETGDNILKEIAKILRSATRTTDLAARWGGDEFTVVLFETTASVEKIIDRMLEMLRSVGYDIDVRVGGIVWNYGCPSATAEELLREADKNERRLWKKGERGALVTVYEG